MWRSGPDAGNVLGKAVESKYERRMSLMAALLLLTPVPALLGCRADGSGRSFVGSLQNEVHAKKFVVVDDTGVTRAEFGMLENGEVGMVVWNEEQDNAVAVSVDHYGMPHIVFQNSKGEALLELAMLGDKHPAIIMRDRNGVRRLGMVITDTGETTIRLYDGKKRNRCSVGLGADDNPQIVLRDEQGKARASLMLDDTGTCALDLRDPKGHAGVVLQVDAEGEGSASVFKSDGEAKRSEPKAK